MSKANKFLTYLSAFMLVLVAVSCVNDDEYSVPEISVDPVDVSTFGTLTTFNAIVGRYEQAVADGDQIATFEFDEPLYIEGYAVSSDQAGNFFEELILQNKTDDSDPTEDPRLGIRIEINVRALSDTYDFGRKVYVKMNDLAVGEANGVITIGKADGNEIGQIEEFEYLNYVIRDSEVATITPKVAAIGDLTEADENTYIQLENMQINRNQLATTYAGEASDSFDGFRTLESCADGGSITLQTSTFADFKSLQVPQLSGNISGIISRDFFDDLTVFVINSIADVDMTGERCDPDFLECTGNTSSANTIFEEDFQSIGDEDDLDAMGWTNVNVSGGSERYEDSSFSGNTYMKISAFGTNESPLEAWLVTPAINLDASTDEELSFDISSNFETGVILSAFITENYTGDPTTTEWTILDANIPVGDGGFGDFESSTMNVSCLNGDVHVAFKYVGFDGGAETRYHIDNIKVTGN